MDTVTSRILVDLGPFTVLVLNLLFYFQFTSVEPFEPFGKAVMRGFLNPSNFVRAALAVMPAIALYFGYNPFNNLLFASFVLTTLLDPVSLLSVKPKWHSSHGSGALITFGINLAHSTAYRAELWLRRSFGAARLSERLVNRLSRIQQIIFTMRIVDVPLCRGRWPHAEHPYILAWPASKLDGWLKSLPVMVICWVLGALSIFPTDAEFHSYMARQFNGLTGTLDRHLTLPVWFWIAALSLLFLRVCFYAATAKPSVFAAFGVGCTTLWYCYGLTLFIPAQVENLGVPLLGVLLALIWSFIADYFWERFDALLDLIEGARRVAPH